MKKRIYLLSFLCLVFCAFGLIGCGGKSDAKITGAKDIALKAEATSYDFSEGVTGTIKGEPAEVTVDSSKVLFGTPGEYDVVYKLKDKSVTVKARIYGTPTITAPNAIQKYSDAVQWTVGVTAKDTFGKELKVTAVPPELDVEGMPIYGETYTVTCAATDAAGNTVTANRTVTVSNEGRPTFPSAEIVLTNVDVPTEIPGTYITALNSDGEEVEAFTQGADGKLYFSGDYFFAHRDSAGKTLEFTLVTTAGYNSFSVRVKEGDAFGVLTFGDITNFIFPAGELIRFPGAKSAPGNAYRYEYLYEVIDASGHTVVSDMFAPEEGNYTFRISARISSEDAWQKVTEQPFYVREETEAFDLAISPQNLNFFSPNVAAGASLEFVEEVTIGAESAAKTSSAYRFAMGTKNETTLDRVLQVDQEQLAKLIKRGLTSISFDVGTTGYENGCTFLNVEFFGQYQTPNGGATYAWGSIGGGLVPNNGWQTYTFDLSKGFTSPSQPTVYTQDASGNVIFTFQQYGLCFTAYSVYPTAYITGSQNVYIRNIRFGRQSEVGNVVNTYKNGEKTITLGENGKATVEGLPYNYEYYGDGTVLFYNGNNSLHDFSMKYTPAGNGSVYANLNWAGTIYRGEFQFEDGDIVVPAEGKVTFELPDFASAFRQMPGFSYALKKYGGSAVLATQPGEKELTETGAYEWTASFTEDGKTRTYVYQFYVCAENDLLSKTRMDAGGKIRFTGMEDGEPVFRAQSSAGGVILYIDGDYIQGLLDDPEISSLALSMTIRNMGSQAFMMWDGGTTSLEPGFRIVLPGGAAWHTLTFDPCLLKTNGIDRGEDKDLYIWFNGGNKLEFKGLNLTVVETIE